MQKYGVRLKNCERRILRIYRVTGKSDAQSVEVDTRNMTGTTIVIGTTGKKIDMVVEEEAIVAEVATAVVVEEVEARIKIPDMADRIGKPLIVTTLRRYSIQMKFVV